MQTRKLLETIGYRLASGAQLILFRDETEISRIDIFRFHPVSRFKNDTNGEDKLEAYKLSLGL